MNSNTVLVNKCDFDRNYIGEMLDKISESVDLEQPENVISSIVDLFLRDIRTTSNSPIMMLKKKVKNENIVVGSTKCENTAPNASLMTMFKHHRNLPTKVLQKEDQ
ncbi:hypothetical protein IEQ34_016514 [Dendrobium chrysotoxum]|uniref:Uncharacterized protein n=1 Tax=Dendrobium chrysotoxum TaxID=161865 RepID=A0AAV7GFS2_DENCH|nr:hypothetical protein IEQ34_016321 [Dendrobium chrysotoxum]KAH0454590.1 hypothetical protein IEQ34_016514 [Dendrobium chrysotoxum]